MNIKPQPLTPLQIENDEKAAEEATIIKAEMRKRMERILQRMKDTGEVKPHVTLDDLLGEDAS